MSIDVAKVHLDIALRPTGERWSVADNDASLTALLEPPQAVHPTLMVLEATGGFQRAVVAAAGLPVVMANPRQTHDCAKATGQLARLDALNARALAHCADAVNPTPRPLRRRRRGADAMGETGLAVRAPRLIDTIASTGQDAFPCLDEGCTGLLWSGGGGAW